MIKHTKTHCDKGHEFTPENTLVRGNGYWLCRTCKRLGEKKRYPNRNKEKDSAAAKRWAKNNPSKAALVHKRAQVRYIFGISLEEYNDRLALQSNLCALCKEPFEGTGASGLASALDHSHASGNIREFIHNSCNKGIGLLRDDPKICRMAAEYLEKHTGDQDVQS